MSSAESEQKVLSRRSFLKGAAVGAAGVAGAGVLAACTPPVVQPSASETVTETVRVPVEVVKEAESKWDYETDVLVVGMGWGGLVAATRASELGADVIAIDKMPSGDWIGGGMPLSLLVIHIAGQSPMLPEEELRTVIATATSNRPQGPHAEAIDALVRNVGRAVNWMLDQGIQAKEFAPGYFWMFEPFKDFSVRAWAYQKPGGVADFRNFGGFKAAKLLESKLQDRGVRLLYETKATKLLTNDAGEVEGLLARGTDEAVRIKAKAVILCTGGFIRNKGMSQQYLGPFAEDIVPECSPGSTGDGHRMALELGAAVKNMSTTYTWPSPAVAEEAEWHDLLGFTAVGDIARAGIIVPLTDDRVGSGERCCDESISAHNFGERLRRLGVVKGLAIVDEAIVGGSGFSDAIEEIVRLGGTVYTANTIEELAAQAGVSPYLATTVAEFNQAIDDGTIGQQRIPKTSMASKIATPPYYAVPFVCSSLFHMGGLSVSAKGEVLDTDKVPIPGLYAAGEVMSGTINGGANYSAYVGNIAGACLTFGLLSAENAVERATT